MMKYLLNKKTIAVSSPFIPAITSAQTFRNAVGEVVKISDVVVPLLMSAALAWFIFGVVMFIQGSDNPEQRKKGKP